MSDPEVKSLEFACSRCHRVLNPKEPHLAIPMRTLWGGKCGLDVFLCKGCAGKMLEIPKERFDVHP